MPRSWIAALVVSLTDRHPEEARRILKECSGSHYHHLEMEATVIRFQGDLPSFLDFLREEWGWIIDFDSSEGLILVNENKSDCVCPLVRGAKVGNLGALCYCSEGFAERLFGAVTGGPVQAEVTESILRGGQRCRYRIHVRI